MLQTQASNGTSQSENIQKTKIFSFSGTLNSLGTIDKLPEFRFSWNSNEEVFLILTSLEEHQNWVANEVKIRPPNGSLILYNRNNLKTRSYHNDKYIWKTRKNSKSSARVDHSSLRIRGIECIYCSYVHSALVPTFHRRCYWLLENPDIVLVHYLNIPDKTTTFDDLVTSLLPYKTLSVDELFCELQPILASGKAERNNNTISPVDVNKLISEVRKYKEPKTKGKRANQRKASGSIKKDASSFTSTKSVETTSKSSDDLDKCTNCNRYYTTKCSTTSTSSRTNVAVIINRQTSSTSSTSRTKPPVADGNCSTQVNFTTESSGSNTSGPTLVTTSSVVQNSVQPDFLLGFSVPRVTSNEGILTTAVIGHNHSSNQMYSCHDLLHQSPYSHVPNGTSLNGCHGYTTIPVTSEANPCMLDNDLMVLDYDGMNLVQSNQTDNDFGKALLNENDINLFENDLLNYLPDYLPDFQSSLHNGPGIISSMTTGPPQVTRQVVSSQNGLPSYSNYGNFVQHSTTTNNDIISRIGRTSFNPTDMITTDCHTFNNLAPSVLNSSSTVESCLLHNGAQCSSNDMSLRGHVFEMGVPGAEVGVSQVVVPEVGASQVGMSQFDVFQVSEAGSSNVPGVQEITPQPQQGVSVMELSKLNGANEGVSNVVVAQRNVHQADSNAKRIEEALPNVCVSQMGLCAARTVSNTGAQLSQAGMPQFDASGVATSQRGVSYVETTLPNVGASLTNISTEGTTQTFSRTSTQSTSEATRHVSENIITEFSPEWSYSDGRTKILILGDWSRNNGQYSCLFDGCSVPATLIQPGVLRCFCPAHEPGLVSLQVAWNGFIISNACVFEYKPRKNATNSACDWLDTSEEDLKKIILGRMERLESILGIGVSSGISVGQERVDENEVCTIEDRLVRICEVLLGKPGAYQLADTETGPKGLTFLHLAAGLGYTKLIRTLQHYALSEKSHSMSTGSGEGSEGVSDTANTKQSTKWSPHAKDSFGCTPLMWACWRGHQDAAMTLLAWKPSSYSDCDQSGRSAKAIAQEMGHVTLVRQMEEFMCGEDMYSLVMENSPQSPSSSCAYLSVSSNEQIPQSPMSADSLTWERVEGVAESSPDFDMASVISEERPNTLGKVLVEVRALIQEAEERAMSSLHTPSNSAPFALGFAGFPDLPSDEGTSDNLMTSEPEFGPRTPHYDTLSIDSSPIRTPSSHSPGSPTIRNSPQSTGTDTSEFEEFLSKPRQFLERDFSELTLTDVEQQELLQAAKIIQNAYRQFKIRKKQHIDELKAAVLIQSYYRRYKQFALYKRITKAAVLIQNSYRAHKEHEQFKRSRHAAAVIQTYFRHYRKRKQRHAEDDAPGKRLGTKYRKSSYEK